MERYAALTLAPAMRKIQSTDTPILEQTKSGYTKMIIQVSVFELLF